MASICGAFTPVTYVYPFTDSSDGPVVCSHLMDEKTEAKVSKPGCLRLAFTFLALCSSSCDVYQGRQVGTSPSKGTQIK